MLFADVVHGGVLTGSWSPRLSTPSTASTSWKVARGAAATSPSREVRTMVECMANHVVEVFHEEGTWWGKVCPCWFGFTWKTRCFWQSVNVKRMIWHWKHGKHGPSYTTCSSDGPLMFLCRCHERHHCMAIQTTPGVVWTKPRGPMKQRRLAFQVRMPCESIKYAPTWKASEGLQ